MTAQIDVTCKYCGAKGWTTTSSDIFWEFDKWDENVAKLIDRYSRTCDCHEIEVLISVLKKSENWTPGERDGVYSLARRMAINNSSSDTRRYYKKKRKELSAILETFEDDWAKRTLKCDAELEKRNKEINEKYGR